jgi:hypothetical protein
VTDDDHAAWAWHRHRELPTLALCFHDWLKMGM